MEHTKTPLRRLREGRGLTLKQVGDAVELDTGSLSRIENRKQAASPAAAERLAAFFGASAISEIEILYPERFCSGEPVASEQG